VTGKSVGSDLAAQKATSVVIAAHQLAREGPRRQLAELMTASALSPADVERWRALIVASGAVQWVEQLIDERLTLALDCVDTATVPEGSRAALRTMAVLCAERAA
jgi:geranylgeranyl diphosphate synthase type I